MDDFHLPDTVALLDRLGLPDDAIVVVIGSSHPLFQANGLRLQAVQAGHGWTFEWSPPLGADNIAASLARVPIGHVRALLVRTSGPAGIDTGTVLNALAPLLARSESHLELAGTISLGDGSIAHVFARLS